MVETQFDKKMKRERIISKINTGLVLIFLILVTLIVLYPLVYLVSAAFSPEIPSRPSILLPFGDGFTIEHYRRLFRETNYLELVLNTLIIAAGTAVSTVAVCAIALCFSRFRFPFKRDDAFYC